MSTKEDVKQGLITYTRLLSNQQMSRETCEDMIADYIISLLNLQKKEIVEYIASLDLNQPQAVEIKSRDESGESKTFSLAIFKKLINDFEDLQCDYSSFGAYDSEPCAIFQSVLEKNWHGEKFMPETAIDWQLYTNISDVRLVAKKLTKNAKEIVSYMKLAQNSTGDDSMELESYLKSYCDRIAWREN